MKKWLVLIIMCAAQFIMVLDTTVMNVSVSNVVEDLDTTIAEVQLAITLYTLVMGSFMLLGGKMGDIFGRKKVFGIGLLIYGAGSMITALSPNVYVLLVGWSGVEGIGAVLVMPAIISLTAANYQGRDRATAYGAIGGISAAGAAAGPLIGGWVTEELTWRVVFASETVICIVIFFFMRAIADSPMKAARRRIDWGGAALSATGLGLIVLALLKAAEWGFIQPTGALVIGGQEITPFGFSVVPFMIAAGFLVLTGFFSWERLVIARGDVPLMHPDILHKLQLRNGLTMLLAQQSIIGGVFFVIPIYLQYVLEKNAFETGLKLMPMSIAMLITAFSGPRLAVTRSPRQIVSGGLVLVIVGALILVASITPEMSGTIFFVGMAVFGAGFGFVASQLGNVIMSSVGDADRGEAGGLQGTAQNIGSSVGVALIGAVLLTSLASGLNNAVATDPTLADSTKVAVQEGTANGVDILTREQLDQIANDSALPTSEADKVIQHYEDAQIVSIKEALLLAALLGALGLAIARRLPTIPGAELGAPDESAAPPAAPPDDPLLSDELLPQPD